MRLSETDILLFRRLRKAAWGALALVWIGIALYPPPATARDTPLRILGLGDSLMQGHGLPPGGDFPARLQAALDADGQDVTVINAGVSGDTSAGGFARLNWSLADHPDAAIVELGSNDALRGIRPQETEANLDAILAKLKDAGVPVLLAGMKAPRNLGPDYVQAFDGIYPKLAAKYSCLLYPFFLDGVALDPALNQPDGMHPNPDGVTVIVKRILPVVEKLITQARAKRAAQ